jgi:hypothetical protein
VSGPHPSESGWEIIEELAGLCWPVTEQLVATLAEKTTNDGNVVIAFFAD